MLTWRHSAHCRHILRQRRKRVRVGLVSEVKPPLAWRQLRQRSGPVLRRLEVIQPEQALEPVLGAELLLQGRRGPVRLVGAEVVKEPHRCEVSVAHQLEGCLVDWRLVGLGEEADRELVLHPRAGLAVGPPRWGGVG